MLQTMYVNGFSWVEETSQFDKDFTKHYNEDRDERYIFDIQYPEKLHDQYLPFTISLRFTIFT